MMTTRLKEVIEVLNKFEKGTQIFFSQSYGNDEKELIYRNDEIDIIFCPDWEYIEILGLTPEEKEEIKRWRK